MGPLIGFIGGTFNPIHNGHLMLAEKARNQFNLDQVLFIPNFIPPHRAGADRELFPAQARYLMAVLATLDNPRFLVSDIEIARGGISYTIDTLRELKREYPENGYYFIGGSDCMTRHIWHKLDEVLDLASGFLLAERAGNGFEQALLKIREISPQNAGKLKKIEMPAMEISSTEIRKRLKSGEPVSDLVPEPVDKFIRKYPQKTILPSEVYHS